MKDKFLRFTTWAQKEWLAIVIFMVMIALFFFWLVGLGVVVGAELNAALTETPEERALNRASGAAAE